MMVHVGVIFLYARQPNQRIPGCAARFPPWVPRWFYDPHVQHAFRLQLDDQVLDCAIGFVEYFLGHWQFVFHILRIGIDRAVALAGCGTWLAEVQAGDLGDGAVFILVFLFMEDDPLLLCSKST